MWSEIYTQRNDAVLAICAKHEHFHDAKLTGYVVNYYAWYPFQLVCVCNKY